MNTATMQYAIPRSHDHPAGLPPEEQFSLGLGFLLDGIARCLAGAETQARSDTMGA
jgi:hypothetical protein